MMVATKLAGSMLTMVEETIGMMMTRHSRGGQKILCCSLLGTQIILILQWEIYLGTLKGRKSDVLILFGRL